MAFWLYFVILVFGLVIVGSIWWYLAVRKQLVLKPVVPGPTPLPIIGNILIGVQGQFNTLNMTKKLQDYGDIVCFWICHYTTFLVASPEYMQVLVNSAHLNDRPPELTAVVDSFLGPGSPLVANGHLWKRSRPAMSNALHSISPDLFFEKMMARNEELLAELKALADQGIVETAAIWKAHAASIVTKVALESPFEKESFINDFCDFDEILQITLMRFFSPIHYFNSTFNLTSSGRKFICKKRIAIEKARKLLQKARAECSESRTAGKPPPNTLMQNYLDECGHMTENELTTQVLTLYGASIDTTGNALSFIILMIAMHPEVQLKLQEEDNFIRSETENRPMEHSDLTKYQYLGRVIKETLRLYPIAPLIARFAVDDIQFGEYKALKGSIILANLFHMQRNPKFFTDPLSFNPDRFLEADKFVPYSYLPFGAGKRGCIGRKYAMMSLKCAMLPIVRHFWLTAEYNTIAEVDENLTGSITIKDKRGVRIKLRKRYLT